MICVNCGIEIDDGLITCPLCGTYQSAYGEQKHIPENYPSEIILLQKKESMRHVWELSALIAFSGIAVCTIVDLTINKGLTWSLLTDVSVIAIWVILTISLFLHKITSLFVLLLMLTILAELFFIDLIVKGMGWFLPVGMPVTVAAFIVAAVVLILNNVFHFNGLNLIASALIAVSGFFIIMEMALDEYLNGTIILRWSLITGVSILPLTLIFFFYHYRLKKGNRLDSFFHV